MNYLMVAIGGMAGALGRYIISGFITKYNSTPFPFGTFTVNIIGSFLLGLLGTLFVEKLGIDPQWKLLVLTGFLGAFTTFSTFEFETLKLLQQGLYFHAAANVLASVLAGLAAIWLGFIIAK